MLSRRAGLSAIAGLSCCLFFVNSLVIFLIGRKCLKLFGVIGAAFTDCN